MPYGICFNLDQSKVLSSGNGLNDRKCTPENYSDVRHVNCSLKR